MMRMYELDSYFNLNPEVEDVSSSGRDFEKFGDDLLEILEEERIQTVRWQKNVPKVKIEPQLNGILTFLGKKRSKYTEDSTEFEAFVTQIASHIEEQS